jgi:protein arginine N-methyltransferase 1
MGEYPVYDDVVYDGLASRDDRFAAYATALRDAAPGRVVLDVGTGRDALWALEAARAGARHVYAIEAAPGAATGARQAIEAAGLGDRVTLLPGYAADQTLPVRAEVCVSELIGNISSAEGAIPVLNDCRARLCTPDCVWVPFRQRTMVAAIALPAVPEVAGQPLADRIRAAGGPAELRMCLGGPASTALASAPAVIESDVFDSRRPAPSAGAFTETVLAVERPASGLLLWTRVAVAATGREVDTLEGGTRSWAPVYIPAALTPGRVTVGLTRRTSDDGVHPDYELEVDGAPVWCSPHHA